MNPRAFLFGDVPDFFARLSASRLFCRFSIPGSADSRCRRSDSCSGGNRPHRSHVLPDLLDQLFAAGKLPHVADAFQ
jgi:hypothetical protein